MKQADVVIGEIYSTRVGNHRVKVKVVERVKSGFLARRKWVRFRCINLTTNRELPKLRSASALQPLKTVTSHETLRFSPGEQKILEKMGAHFKPDGECTNIPLEELSRMLSEHLIAETKKAYS